MAELTSTVNKTYDLDAGSGLATAMENAGQRYNEVSQQLKAKQKAGETVNFVERRPPFAQVFMQSMLWAAEEGGKPGAPEWAKMMKYM